MRSLILLAILLVPQLLLAILFSIINKKEVDFRLVASRFRDEQT